MPDDAPTGRRFVWEAHEPRAAAQPYTDRKAAVASVLDRVTDWENRFHQPLCFRDESRWQDLTSAPTLLHQLEYLALNSPTGRPPSADDSFADGNPPVKRSGDDETWIHSQAECRACLAWILLFFRARLEDRARAAHATGGVALAAALCNEVADWLRPEPCEDIFGPDLSPFGFHFERTSDHAHSWQLTDAEEFFTSRFVFGFNGYEDECWGRFLSATDEVKVAVSESTTLEPASTVQLGTIQIESGYSAPEYGAAIRCAFSREPRRFLSRGRSVFKVLREAAGLSAEEMRTVKRQVGYEGDARGFVHFLDLLFKAVGETTPK